MEGDPPSISLREWQHLSPDEQGALLLDLAATLRLRLQQLELDQSLTLRYRAFAQAAHIAGQALLDRADLPFDPDPPFRWSKIPMEEVNRRIAECADWADPDGGPESRQADLAEAFYDLALAGNALTEEIRRQSR